MSEDTSTFIQNDNLVLISGETGTGKSASLFEARNDPGIWYANCESGKKLPFPAKFKQFIITDPMQIYELFEEAENHDDIHTIVIDTFTFLMDMFESQYVIGSDGFEGWKQYAEYIKKIMQFYVAKSTKNVIILAHTSKKYDSEEMVTNVAVPIKGATKEKGLEAFFSTVISTKKIVIKELLKYDNPWLNITEEDKELGFKRVFQTRLTKDTIHDRIRGPMGMWDKSETYIDNNIMYVIQRLQEYYGENN